MSHTLEADSIELAFNGRTILSDIYIKCETGEITGLLGRNGQGKSSLMKIIYGSLLSNKSVRFDRIPVSLAYTRPDLLMYLPQSNFIPGQLTLKRIFNDFELEYTSFEKKFPAFKAKYKNSINSLSGGERRLVEVYVIIASKSRFALLDEPFTHLNPIQIEQVVDLLQEEKHTKGLLITDHMYRHVLEISDNLYLLTDGQTRFISSLTEIEALGYARLEKPA